MAKIPKTKWELAPEGTHNAVCIKFIDLGTQDVTFKGETKESRLCRIYFDLVDCKTKTGENVVIFQKYTYSASAQGNLSKDLRSWLGVKNAGDFDLATIIGKPALVKVEHSENGEYANIKGIMELPKGVKVKKSTEEQYALFLTPEDFDANVFNELPEKLQATIMDSKTEYAECTAVKTKKKAVTTPAKKTGKK